MMDIVDIGVAELERDAAAFGELLHACVHAGASISFVLPFSEAEAMAFWISKVRPALLGGRLVLLAARTDEGRLAGAVQLDHDTPPNQPHRAEVRKLLVHPGFRRRGLARTLMERIEDRARDLGRTLITLDTRTGDFAEPLYRSIGYRAAGIIPGYCRDPLDPAKVDSTTIMYKLI
ncbi:MAG: GNAT family N-acetyltransferase [Alphaproteobacteria bacterium]|nr:GNAT family N-acetyltransferase [Alphaproteobacteria bacterium]